MTHLLEVRNLRKTFQVSAGPFTEKHLSLKAVDDVSFNLHAGETLGLVGESGCGKSTTGKTILRLQEPDSGEIRFDGNDLLSLSAQQMRDRRRDLQMIFQDPYSSLNPRMRVVDIVGEPLKIHGLAKNRALRQEVAHLLQTVGMDSTCLDRYPHEFSGGQRQRIGIARALALKPRLIVADEPVSALDLSIQAQVVNLMQDIQQQFNLTYLFIAHDLSIIEHISDRIAVMYLGRIVELTPAEELYRNPRHPYSEALLNAVPIPDPHARRQKRPLVGEIPSPLHPPSGCHFHPRCPYAKEQCRNEAPALIDQGGGHLAACHFSDKVGCYRINR